jgi:hypothetical protein
MKEYRKSARGTLIGRDAESAAADGALSLAEFPGTRHPMRLGQPIPGTSLAATLKRPKLSSFPCKLSRTCLVAPEIDLPMESAEINRLSVNQITPARLPLRGQLSHFAICGRNRPDAVNARSLSSEKVVHSLDQIKPACHSCR